MGKGSIRLRSFERFATAIVLIALPTCLVFAQTSAATILGVVKDTTGALIPGVSITVKHTETGLARSAISSETGDYNVPLLPVGAYEISTAMPGLAWDPTGKGTWSVRAAFGIHNDLTDNLGIRAQPNPPFAAREALPVANGFLPLLPLNKNVALPP